MMPAAMGSQVVGSVIRPASYCGNFGFKPTMGWLNRGGSHSVLSQAHLGVHAGSLEDMWAVACHTAAATGGDPGYPGFYGAPRLPQAQKPRRLIRLDCEGWPQVEEPTRAAFQALLDWIAGQGVEIVTRRDQPLIEAFEQSIADALALSSDICAWETRWPFNTYRDKGEDMLSPRIAARLEAAEAMSADDFRRRLAERWDMRRKLTALMPLADGLITLPALGPAPMGTESAGSPVYNAPQSATGAPALSLPLMAVDGMPMGVQLMGFLDQDERLVAQANWLLQAWKQA
jgi:Asp-tRNA(Asn)/Glu-tRNA(Gln) amidotransferase A subunit family amidase